MCEKGEGRKERGGVYECVKGGKCVWVFVCMCINV